MAAVISFGRSSCAWCPASPAATTSSAAMFSEHHAASSGVMSSVGAF
jgi:hypothetical protein